MAPPKRKTGGRTTAPSPRSGPSAGRKATPAPETDTGHASGRYTAPTAHEQLQSPNWVPTLMLALFALGAAAIITRYLWWDSNLPMLVGIAAILGGLGVATQWR